AGRVVLAGPSVQLDGGGRPRALRDDAGVLRRGLRLGAFPGDARGELAHTGGHQHVQRVLRREARPRHGGLGRDRGFDRRGPDARPRGTLGGSGLLRGGGRPRVLPRLRRGLDDPGSRAALGARRIRLLGRAAPPRVHGGQRGRRLPVHGRPDRGYRVCGADHGPHAARLPGGPPDRRARGGDPARQQHPRHGVRPPGRQAHAAHRARAQRRYLRLPGPPARSLRLRRRPGRAGARTVECRPRPRQRPAPPRPLARHLVRARPRTPGPRGQEDGRPPRRVRPPVLRRRPARQL
ncbi:MAG: 1,4-dihydroxy-2-naphthoate polyprenyltransferase, partial [uncultured Rubrobacteraceae bacterium]